MLNPRITARRLTAAWLLLWAASAAAAPSEAVQQEIAVAAKQANAAMQRGPADIQLLEQATLKLPAGYGFVPNPAATAYMKAIGNGDSPNRVGLILPLGGAHWLMDVRFEKSGYIKDDDAKNWDVDKLLQNLKDGTAANNKERVARGFPEFEITGWVEAPKYQAGSHQLVWSLAGREQPAPAERSPTVNYNTYLLGRDGYFSMDLVTDLASVDGYKGDAQTLLDALAFDAGKRYQDFDSSTDKVAEYGLAALVGGVVLKKIGLFALAAAFFVKIWKLILVTVLGGAAAVRKFLRNKTEALKPQKPGGNVS